MAKTAEEVAKMSDEELLEAAKAGELDGVDGSDSNQRATDDDEGGESGADDEGGDADADDSEGGEDKGDDEDDDDAGGSTTDDDGNVTVGGKTYSAEEYETLLAELEASNRKVPQARLMEEATARREAEKREHQLELRIARAEGAAEAEAAAREAARAAAEAAKPKYDFDKAEEEYIDLVQADDRAGARAKRAEIRDEENKQRKAETEAAVAASQLETKRQLTAMENRRALDAVASTLYPKYPFLNNESKDADENAIYAVLAKRDRLVQQGEAPTAALRRAMTEVGEAELKKRPAKKVLGEAEKRKVEALRKALKANDKQPPRPGGIGNRVKDGTLTARDIKKMSDEDFEKLSPEDLARIDGRSTSQRMRA